MLPQGQVIIEDCRAGSLAHPRGEFPIISGDFVGQFAVSDRPTQLILKFVDFALKRLSFELKEPCDWAELRKVAVVSDKIKPSIDYSACETEQRTCGVAGSYQETGRCGHFLRGSVKSVLPQIMYEAGRWHVPPKESQSVT